jgi:hypothetical protein
MRQSMERELEEEEMRLQSRMDSFKRREPPSYERDIKERDR